jgi:uncharacterized protein YndB with AHSA1/START domain
MSSDTTARSGFQLAWTIKATPQAVFRAWTDPAELGWFFSDAMPRPDEPVEVDLRVGGFWRVMMVHDADHRYWTGGLYKVIEPGERLAFWWGAVGGWPELDPARPEESPLVEIRLKATAEGVELVMDVELPPGMAEPAARSGLAGAMRAGWTDTVDRLARQMS